MDDGLVTDLDSVHPQTRLGTGTDLRGAGYKHLYVTVVCPNGDGRTTGRYDGP